MCFFPLSVTHRQVVKTLPVPFADVIGCLLGEHPLLEHVVECMNRAQLQSLLLMKHFSFAHTNASPHTEEEVEEEGEEERAPLTE